MDGYADGADNQKDDGRNPDGHHNSDGDYTDNHDIHDNRNNRGPTRSSKKELKEQK